MRTKEELKQVGMFMLLCLPISWLLTAVAYEFYVKDEQIVPWAAIMMNIVCFMPMIAAVLACKFTKEKVSQLKMFPNLQGNGKVYALAILIGVALSLADYLITTLFFPDMYSLAEGVTTLLVVFAILDGVAKGCLQFFALMGEEVGWMGYLYPRMEKLCGTTLALILTGIIRGCWHIVMLAGGENFGISFVTLCISNILLGSVLVLVTKVSNSVIPAAIVHALTNVVPVAIASILYVDSTIEKNNQFTIGMITMIPAVLLGGACYVILIKKYQVKRVVWKE